MDKVIGSGHNSQDIKIWPQENCRFAYTLGTSQPVRCSWISDQPLFYTDCEEVADEDFMMDDPVLDSLERDIADLRDKTNAYDKVASEYAKPAHYIKNLFAEDASFISSTYVAPKSTLDTALEILQQSRLASQLISFALLNNIAVRESLHVVDASYDRSAQAVLVRGDLDMPTKVLLVARELRRMWQHKNGAGLHPLAVHPDYAVLVNRAQHADLMVSMIRVSWELQLSGYKDAWFRIENSTMVDLGRAFAREAIADFRSINNGLAARATFESWFLSERCRRADRTLIQQMLADYQGYTFSDNVDTSRLIALDMMRALGKMPFGTNYLETIAAQIVHDPVFTEVRDRSNANFLWFIKFERSFTEAESEVALKETLKPETAKILAFPDRKIESGKSDGTETVGHIVELRRPAGE